MDPQKLDQKEKSGIYTTAIDKIYNWWFRWLFNKTHELVKFKKYSISWTKNFFNLDSPQFYKISEILWSADVVPKYTENNNFYLNNYID